MNNKSIITTLSLIGVLATSNMSFAGSGGGFFLSKRDFGIEKSNKSSKSEDTEGFLNLLKVQDEYKKNRLNFNYIFGSFLEFGEGKISIENLEEEIQNKINICKQKEEAALKSGKEDEVNKLLLTATREAWEKISKAVSADKKLLLNKKTSIKKLREKYKEKAMDWFVYQYGVKNKKEGNSSNCPSLNTKSQESINKSSQNNK